MRDGFRDGEDLRRGKGGVGGGVPWAFGGEAYGVLLGGVEGDEVVCGEGDEFVAIGAEGADEVCELGVVSSVLRLGLSC